MDQYCRNFVEDIFSKHDSNQNNVLERRKFKVWINEELKNHKYLKRQTAKKDYEEFFAKADANGDGKIDRRELYDYCFKNMTMILLFIVYMYLIEAVIW